MTNDQIQELDKCRKFNESLNKASGEVKSILSQVKIYSNDHKGKDLDILSKEFERKIWEAFVDCQKGIDNIISEI